MTNPLLARFASQPALVTPHMDDWFQACVMGAAAHDRFGELSAATASNDDGFWFAADDWRAAYRPYVVKDGILQIPVKGVLLHDFPWSLGSWATGYAYIWRAFERGLADFGVRGIALMCDTPGGMVAGCFELVDKMFAARGTKPVRAFAHESAYSAGYAIASVADKIAVSRTGGVGSIGVVTMHADFSKAFDQAGLKITFIYAGKHKVDGNSTAPLPDDVKARIQSRIDDIYGVFVASVARNRSLEEKAVRATEALTFTGPEAVSNGLADAIGSLDDAVAAFAADLSPPQGDDDMSTKDTTATEQAAALATARAEGRAEGLTEGEKSGRAAATAEATTAERTRIQAILGHENAKDRGEMASHLAFATDMTAEAAAALLGKAPKQQQASTTQTPKDRLDAALAEQNPTVGADAAPGSDGGNRPVAKGYDAGKAIVDRVKGRTAA